MNLQQVSHSEHNWTQRTTLSRVHSVQRHLLNRTLRLSDYLLKNTWRWWRWKTLKFFCFFFSLWLWMTSNRRAQTLDMNFCLVTDCLIPGQRHPRVLQFRKYWIWILNIVDKLPMWSITSTNWAWNVWVTIIPFAFTKSKVLACSLSALCGYVSECSAYPVALSHLSVILFTPGGE